jgi:hypothetical protein
VARSARRPVSRPAAGPAAQPAGPRTWQGLVYRPCPAEAAAVRRLFHFAGAWTPAFAPGELAWEAVAPGGLVGGVLVERDHDCGFIHGPVVVEPPPDAEALEVAAQLAAPLLEPGTDPTMTRAFARPGGLDRLWVRLGFVPMPEASLPPTMRDRPGTGLYVWRRPGTYAVAAPQRPGPEDGPLAVASASVRPRGRRSRPDA